LEVEEGYMNEMPLQAIADTAKRYGAVTVSVFGSRARGDARPEADLDHLVRMRQGATLFDLIKMQTDLENLLGLKVDVISEGDLRPELRNKILSEARVIAGEEDHG
jgi:predicted nucleotidyltransferase